MTIAPDEAGSVAKCSTSPQSNACCPLSDGPLGTERAKHMAALLKALADPVRLQLLSHIATQGCETVCVCSLTDGLGISQPTVSHHMKKLVDAGLVTREQRGKWAHYTVMPEAFMELRGLLELG